MEADLGHLPAEMVDEVVCNNAARVFNGGRLPPPAEKAPEDYEADVRMWVKSSTDFGVASRMHNAPEAGRIRTA